MPEGTKMEYIKKYCMIATAMFGFEKKGCDFYLSLATKPSLKSIERLLRQTGYEKAKELDIISGMVSVSEFLLNDNKTGVYDTEDIDTWLRSAIPDIYNDTSSERIAMAKSPQEALSIMIELEERVLDFYRAINARITMDTTQINSIIARQKRHLACLSAAKYQLEILEFNSLRGPAGAMSIETGHVSTVHS